MGRPRVEGGPCNLLPEPATLVPMTPRPDGDRDAWGSIARYSEIGFIIPAAVLLGFGLGKLADYFFHTTWLYLAGVIFGAVVGFVQMIRMATSAPD